MVSVETPLHTTDFTYECEGALTQAVRKVGGIPLQTRSYTRDGRGFLMEEILPEIGFDGSTNGKISYTRDALGNVRTMTDPVRTRAYTYDAGGRPLSMSAGGQLWQDWIWGTTGGTTSFGKLIEARRHNYPFGPDSDWTISESYDYNGVLGALSQRTTQIQFPTNPVGSQYGEAFTQQWSYTPLGNVATATYPTCITTPQEAQPRYCNDGNDQVPLAHTVTSQYNQGLPTRVTSNRGPWADFEYNPNLTLSRIGHSNETQDVHEEDPQGQARPRRIRIQKVNAPNSFTTYYDTGGYQYDEAGNIWAIGPDRYTYDQAGRLTSGQMLRFGSNIRENYSYDPNDNLLSLHRLSDPAPLNWSVDAKNRVRGPLNAPNDIFYDGAGNTVNIARHANGVPIYVMTYDALNMQTSFTVQSSTGVQTPDYRYVYGPGNYRFLVWDGTTRTVTLRGLDNKTQRRYIVTGFGPGAQWNWEQDSIYGPNGLFATTRSDGDQWHYHPDHLGSPRILTNQNGSYITERQYHPYGTEYVRYEDRPDDLSAKFTGHERDANKLTDYMLGRTYVFPFARFASVDPARDGWNLYGYVGQNPMGAVDPTGRLKRDVDGNLVFVPANIGRVRHPSDPNTAYVVQGGHLFTDKGRPVEALSVHPLNEGDPTGQIIDVTTGEVDRTETGASNPMCTNCHGVTFGDGKFTISNNQVGNILADDGYALQGEGGAQVGDVLIYRDGNGNVVHSATVSLVDGKGNISTVSGLGGLETEVRNLAPGPGVGAAWERDASVERYRKGD